MKQVFSSLLVLLLFCRSGAETPASIERFSPPSRSFHFSYKFAVKEIPPGTKRIRVWVPVPQSDEHQSVRVISVQAPAKSRLTREHEYGNRMMFAELPNPAAGNAEFALEYEITRREYTRGDYERLKQSDRKPALVS